MSEPSTMPHMPPSTIPSTKNRLRNVAIAVTNVNEGPGAVSDANAGTNTVAENAANGTVVGVTASATDPEGDAVTYSLVDNAGGRFAINATTGVVTHSDHHSNEVRLGFRWTVD